MKRIAALSLVAAMAATGVAADNAKIKPTVSTQAGLGLAGMGAAGAVIGVAAIAVAVAAADAASGT